MKIFLKIIAAILIITASAELLINRSQNTLLALLFVAVLLTCIYYLIYKPLKTLL